MEENAAIAKQLEKEKKDKIAKLDEKFTKMIEDYKRSVAVKITEIETQDVRLTTFKDVNVKSNLNIAATLYLNASNKFEQLILKFKKCLLLITKHINYILYFHILILYA